MEAITDIETCGDPNGSLWSALHNYFNNGIMGQPPSTHVGCLTMKDNDIGHLGQRSKHLQHPATVKVAKGHHHHTASLHQDDCHMATDDGSRIPGLRVTLRINVLLGINSDHQSDNSHSGHRIRGTRYARDYIDEPFMAAWSCKGHLTDR